MAAEARRAAGKADGVAVVDLYPGFRKAKLDTLIKIDSPQGHRQVTVKGYGHNAIQVAREANWQLAYQRAFEDYLKQFADAAGNNGL